MPINKTDITKIRPAARIISTIGEDIVKDVYSAIVEIVKNAYDADASFIEIIFEYKKEKEEDVLKIEIKDNGHGMSTNIVLNKWLVPATKDKLDRTKSPKGRLLQGRKGIGRYAVAILGQELLLKTTDENNEQTEVFIDWDLFEQKEFLEDVDIIVTSRESKEEPGTLLIITAKKNKKEQWGRNEIARLTKELQKIKSPLKHHAVDQFEIKLAFINCPFEEYNNEIFEIEPSPIIELFDYRISGSVSEQGKVVAVYENCSELNLPSENIEFNIDLDKGLMYCGPVQFDFRVFDRDKEAIENLINKGLIDPISKLAIGKREAKAKLDEVYGVNLYREGFRISPYGNGGIDWLDLDKDRIQNPSMRVSNNQIVGSVNIKSEKISHLEEKSSRDGLKENSYYFGLIYTLKSVLQKLQERRFNYRKKTGKGRHAKNIQNELNELFDFADLTEQIKQKLTLLKIEEKTIGEISNILSKEAERKSKLLENIQNTIAIYQGQATLGKIVTVLLHEGRKPISYFRQQAPNLIQWMEYYKSNRDWEDPVYNDIYDRLVNFKEQGNVLSQLFKRLDPLAKQSRGWRKEFRLRDAILKAFAIFEGSFLEGKIQVDLSCDESVVIYGWEEDILIALTNLLENSLYWLSVSDNVIDKKISIVVIQDKKDIIIHYKDNGVGIDKNSIENGAIFEPGYSKKLNGTGLGLPIAGEAIERLGGHILAHFSDNGAYFTVELNVINKI